MIKKGSFLLSAVWLLTMMAMGLPAVGDDVGKTARLMWSAPLPELVKPLQIAANGKELAVVEDAYVFAYALNANNLRLTRKMGKKGEGPGEFDTNAYFRLRLEWRGGDMMLYTHYKMGLFTRQGQLLEEKHFPFFIYRLIPFGDGYALTKSTLDEKNNQISVNLADAKLKPITTVYRRDYLDSMRSGTFSVFPDFVYSCVDQNTLYVFDNRGDFTIRLFDLRGKPVDTLKLDIPRLKISGERKKQIQEWIGQDWRFSQMGESWRKKMIIPDSFPVFRTFSVSNGKIYVHTFNRRDARDEFIILDRKGKVIARVFLPHDNESLLDTDPYVFFEGRYYVLRDNQELEQWMLNVFEIR